MDQTLDMQVAALIFLAGTKNLVTSDYTGDVEKTNDNEEIGESMPITGSGNRNQLNPSNPVHDQTSSHSKSQIF